MTKSFKIARKPGQVSQEASTVSHKTSVGSKQEHSDEEANMPNKTRPTAKAKESSNGSEDDTAMTRKTIEVPTRYFYQVKMRALERRMLEKELWSEIVAEYFERHPTL